MKKTYEDLKDGILSIYVKAKNRVSNEDGVTTVEWVGLAAVTLAIMMGIAGVIGSSGGISSLADNIVNKIGDLVNAVNAGGGSE